MSNITHNLLFVFAQIDAMRAERCEVCKGFAGFLGRAFGRNQKGFFALIVTEQDGNMAKRQTEKVHDRRSSDLPTGSVVSIAIVADPYSQIGEKIEVLRSVRDDPLAGMYSRSQIDDAQFRAGRKWQEYHENSEIGGGIKTIDPGKPKVDGGMMADPLPDKALKAFRKIAESDQALGVEGSSLLRDILGHERMSVSKAALARNCHSEKEINYITRRFRECLESLAILWGLAS